MSSRTDPIDAFAAALRSRIEDGLERQPPTPDVADVVDRALALDHDAVPDGLRDSLPPHDVDAPELEVPELAPFSASLRGVVERGARDRAMAAIPRAPARRPTGTWVALAAVALAAGLILIVRGTWLSEATEEQDASQAWMGARHDEDERDALHEVQPHASPRDPEGSSDGVGSREQPTAVLPEPRLEGDAPTQPQSHMKRRSDARAPGQGAGKQSGPTLDELEVRARRHWRAGELERAEELLRILIARGNRTQAELAYGDLFALERQRGGPSAQAGAWREYLRRFPEGRFAEDAKAGLCGGAQGSARETCWRAYLRDHPDGSHARRARAELAEEEE